jgi:hypothetical protein
LKFQFLLGREQNVSADPGLQDKVPIFDHLQDVKNDPGSTVFFSKQDYNKLSPGLKFAARFFRDPFVFFSLTASLFFWLIQPFPKYE